MWEPGSGLLSARPDRHEPAAQRPCPIYARATPPGLQRPTTRAAPTTPPGPTRAQPERARDYAVRSCRPSCCASAERRDELQDDGRGGRGGGGVRRRVGRRGGPVPGQRRRWLPPPVRAPSGAAEEDELRQHLRHVRHDGAPPRQEGAVDVLPGQIAVVRVHGGGEVPGGPAEEGQAAAQHEALQELRRARRHGHGRKQAAAAGLLLRQPRPHGRRRLQGSPERPSVV